MSKKKKSNQTARKRQSKQNAAPQVARTPDRHRFPLKISAFILLSLLLLGAAYIFGIPGLSKGKQILEGDYRDYNVLIITLDTLRADHLPSYGYDQVQTPNLDQFVKTSFVFEDLVAHVPLTVPSHSSIFTGMLPIAHGVRDNGGYLLDQKETTLAEIFKSKGYNTSAFVSAFVLDSRWQLDQGFDVYFDNFNLAEFKALNPQDAQRTAGETQAEVELWLRENKDKRFFSWVHFYDPHEPYEPPEHYKNLYPSRPYDGEIAYTDEIIGKLLKLLEDLKLSEKTIVLITSDHGEGLGEHGEMTHAMFVYDTTQHVPLFIHLPGTNGTRISGIVNHIDLAPTILQLVGIQPPQTMQGGSLIPLMNSKEKKQRRAYSESMYAELHYGWSPVRSIATAEYKYIDVPKAELYDRREDPGELVNLINEKPAIAKVLKSELNEMLTRFGRADLKGPSKIDPETEEKLRALGYIGSTVQATEESRKIDPKDKKHLARAIHMAFAEVQSKNYQVALDLLAPVLKEDPSMTDAHFVAGAAHCGLKQYEQGLDEYLKTLALRPDNTMALYNVADIYEQKGNLPEAELWYKKVLKYEPNHLDATLKLAHLFRRMKNVDQAQAYFSRVVENYNEFLQQTRNDKARSALHSTIGEIYFGAGNLPEAEKHMKAAIALTPDRNLIHYNLAQVYEAKGDLMGAVAEYRKEIEVNQTAFKAYNDLGILLRRAGQLEKAATCFQKVIELLPDDPRGYVMLATVYKEMGREQEAMYVLQRVPQRQNVVQQ